MHCYSHSQRAALCELCNVFRNFTCAVLKPNCSCSSSNLSILLPRVWSLTLVPTREALSQNSFSKLSLGCCRRLRFDGVCTLWARLPSFYFRCLTIIFSVLPSFQDSSLSLCCAERRQTSVFQQCDPACLVPKVLWGVVGRHWLRLLFRHIPPQTLLHRSLLPLLLERQRGQLRLLLPSIE